MDIQPESRAVLIETALNGWFQIPPEIIEGKPSSSTDKT